MISPAKILASYLISQGLFTAVSAGSTWPLYRSSLPDSDDIQDDCGVIYDTPGIKDGRQMSDGENLFHHGIQVRIRAINYDTAKAKAEEVAVLFAAVARLGVVVDSITYIVWNISQISDVIPLGVEEETKRRQLFTVNFMVTIKEE